MKLAWKVVSLLTGSVIADVPDLIIQGSLRRVIGQYESATVELPLGSAPSNLDEILNPGAVAYVAINTDTNTPLWGGYLTQPPRSEAASVALSLATIEAYFDRRYVGTVSFTGADQCTLGGTLVASYAQAGAKPGLPIRVATTTSAHTRNRAYFDYDSTKLYAALQELMGVTNGPEWTVDWEWSDPTHLTPVVYIADRIGSSPIAGLQPATTWFLGPGGGNILSFTYTQDYTDGNGANDITALGSGQGLTRPSYRQVVTNFQGRPTFEYRFTPPAPVSVADTLTLQAAAQRKATRISNGSTSIAITASLKDGPTLGSTWFIGDDLAYNITAPSVPDGLVGVARAAGYELTDTTITPILVTPEALADGSI